MRVFVTYPSGKTESFHAVQNVENRVDAKAEISGIIIETKTGIHRRDFADFTKFEILS